MTAICPLLRISYCVFLVGMYRMTSYVNQGLRTRILSVPKNPEFEHVIPKAFVDLFDDWRRQH
jgi:hypothetical protein